MLAVRINSFPASPADMAALFESTVREYLRIPSGRPIVTMAGGQWPVVDEFIIEASESEPTGQRPPKPPEAAIDAEVFRARTLSLQAKPLRSGAISIDLSITAENAAFGYVSDPEEGGWIALSSAENGNLDATVPLEALEQAMLLAGAQAAREKGADIQSVQLDAAPAGDSTAVTALITARKGFVKGTVRISGLLTIASSLHLTVSKLKCEGEGLVGTALSGLIQTQLAKVEGGTIPLNLPLGGIRLRDMRIEPHGRNLRIMASFGEAPDQEGQNR